MAKVKPLAYDRQADAHPVSQSPDRKRRIVFILPAFGAGGAERVLVTLCNHLDPVQFDVHFIGLSDGPIRSWIKPDIPVHILGIRRVSLSYGALYKALKALKPDIVVSSLIHMNMLVLLLKPLFPRTRFIVRESSLPSVLMAEYGIKGNLCRYIYKYLYPYADAVISPTRVIVDEFRQHLKLTMKNHQTIYNPVDVEKIEKAIAPQFPPRMNPRCVHFVCAGRLSFEKGFDRLIEALPDLQLSYDWRLDILGEGELRPKLEALIRAHRLEGRVFLQGYRDNPWNTIAQADCLLVPSFWEGMPNIVLESLVCGTQVIGIKDAGGIVEIAALAQKGRVHVAANMDDFIYLMNAVEPQPKTSKHPSLLPEDFLLHRVMERFEVLLSFSCHPRGTR